MILDAQNRFSEEQEITANDVSTILDLGPARQIQEGVAMGILVTVDVAADFDDANEVYQIDLETDSDAGFGTSSVVFSTVLTAAQLTLGAQIFLPIPNLVLLKQYIRLSYVVAGTTPSVTLTAFLQEKDAVDEYRSYPNNSVIS